MSAFQDEQSAPLSGAALYARLFNVDLQTAALALQTINPVQRPVGMQLFGAITMQDARQTLGIFTAAAVKVNTYTFGR